MPDLIDSDKQALERAWDLMDEEVRLPRIAKQPYHGPSEALTALFRGAAMGGIGYFAGRYLGKLAEPIAGVEIEGQKLSKGVWQVALKWALGAVGAVLGVQSGSREVRDGRLQTEQLQKAIERLNDQNVALKKELKAQLRGKGNMLRGIEDLPEHEKYREMESMRDAPDSRVSGAQRAAQTVAAAPQEIKV